MQRTNEANPVLILATALHEFPELPDTDLLKHNWQQLHEMVKQLSAAGWNDQFIIHSELDLVNKIGPELTGINWLMNVEPEQGISHALQIALHSLSNAAGVLLFPINVNPIDQEILTRLRIELSEIDGRSVALHIGKRFPLWVGKAYWGAINLLPRSADLNDLFNLFGVDYTDLNP